MGRYRFEGNLRIKPHHLKEAYRTTPERVFLENTKDGQTHNRVDIVIEGEAFLLFIEVKIGAGEGDNQLKRYAQIMQSCAENKNKPCGLVFLTRVGEQTKTRQRGLLHLAGSSLPIVWRKR